jgi:hypothetical protein
VNGISGTAKVEARSRADSFELKHLGSGRWKIYYQPGVIVCLEKRSAADKTKLVLRPDFNGPETEWVFFDIRTNQSFIPRSMKEESTSGYNGTLKAAISTKHVGTQYFQMADGTKFESENANGELQAYLDDLDTSAQWTAVLDIVRAVPSNRDTAARRSMYKALAESNIKKGSNFAENLLKGQVVKQINQAGAKEKDPVAKKYLNALAGKF